MIQSDGLRLWRKPLKATYLLCKRVVQIMYYNKPNMGI